MSRTERYKSGRVRLNPEYEQYTLGLALFDMVPVLLFLVCGLILWSMYGSPVFLAGVIASFIGGTCKALWKLIVVIGKRDRRGLTTAFHILLPGGFVLMLLAVVIDVARDSISGKPLGEGTTLSSIWSGISVMPAPLLFIAGLIGMCLMGHLGSRMDESKGMNWLEEIINTLAQLALLAGAVVVYFGMFYPATDMAQASLSGTDSVRITAVSEDLAPVQEVSGSGQSLFMGGSEPAAYYFDGPGTDTALVFYPGAKVEAAAYAPLMLRLADTGIDCYLCRMPFNFALADKDAAAEIREAYYRADGTEEGITAGEGNDYKNWYIGGHSLGGVAASMLVSEDNTDDWDGIIFLASYPAGKLGIPALSIYGSEDKVLSRAGYAKADAENRWPEDFTEEVISGGDHAQFGDYGEQKGDGNAYITADRQQTAAAELIAGFAGK